MKQETGNNISGQTKELSIQIALNGFSFSISSGGVVLFQSKPYPHFDIRHVYAAEPRLAAAFDTVSAGWSTDMVQLIPAEFFDPTLCHDYMAAANMLMAGTEPLYHCPPSCNMVAIWQADSYLLETINELYPQAYHFHYLITGDHSFHRDTIDLIIMDELAHIKVYNSRGLFAAETARYTALEDILYYVKRLSGGDTFAQYTLNLTAPRLPQAADFFGAYYRNIQLRELPTTL